MDEWTSCEDCGFGCLKSQRTKTKGLCPRCNADEGKKFVARVNHFKNGGNKNNIPQEAK
jgi:predicted Zn-ribbon and HTH transcriptional regulator